MSRVHEFYLQEEDVIERLRACPQYDSRQLDLDPELVSTSSLSTSLNTNALMCEF